ncbi:MAG TPA: hypothetical protein VGS27_07645 [Candidatus Sulfotelmatobacter sp.]|nr:hypothetical protein [Candidatus Sulfotelmatobacter sp.]
MTDTNGNGSKALDSSQKIAAKRAELSGSPSENKAQSELLSGWKDIANYLGKGIRTVQRYELELGLPIRRPAGKMRGSVLATRSELDAWIAASPMREAPPPEKMPKDSFERPALHDALREHRELRARMSTLSDELRTSVAALQASMLSVFGADLFPAGGTGFRGIDDLVEATISRDQQLGSTRVGSAQFDGYRAQTVLGRINDSLKSERNSA